MRAIYRILDTSIFIMNKLNVIQCVYNNQPDWQP